MIGEFMRFMEADRVELKEKICDSLPKKIKSFLNTEVGVFKIPLGCSKRSRGVHSCIKMVHLCHIEITGLIIKIISPYSILRSGHFVSIKDFHLDS